MMSCIPDAVCSSSATFATIEIGPNPKSIPVVTVIVSPAGMSMVPFTVLLINLRDIISERTKEGLKHARNVGKRGKDKKRRRRSGYYKR